VKPSAAVGRRLRALTQSYGLPAGAEAALATLLDRLWDEHAPTTVRDPADAVDVHVADALTALEVEPVRAARRLADLGAGAGIPGLVLAAALPGCRVALVESVGRKGDFIADTADRMGLGNVEVVRARAEEWTAAAGCDVVTARALAALPVLVEYAAPLLRRGGVLVAWKGDVEAAERADGEAAAAATGLAAAGIHRVRPFPESANRTLHVYAKVMETPARFPRRAGMAAKRPLGARS